MRHASSNPTQQASASASLTSHRHLTSSPPAVLVAVNSSYRPTRSPSRHHSKHQNTTPPRPPASSDARHDCCCKQPQTTPATSRKVCLNHTQSIACLLARCPLFRDPRGQPSAKPPFNPYIANLSVFRATRCGYLRFVPAYRGHLLSGGLLLEEHRKQALARINRQRDRTIPRSLVREVEHNLDTRTGPQPRDVMRK